MGKTISSTHGGRGAAAARRFTAFALAAVLVSVPMQTEARLSDYDTETAARLADNKLEYDELANLIREYNPDMKYAYDQIDFTENDTESSVRDMRDYLEDNEKSMDNDIASAKKLIDQLGALPDSEQKQQQIAGLEQLITGYEALRKLPSSTKKSTDKQLDNVRKQLNKGVEQMTRGAQTLMVAYDMLSAQIKTLEKVEELQKRSVEAAKVAAGIGAATDTGVLSAQSGLLETQSQLTSLKSTADGLKSQLCTLTGWATDGSPEIGEVPAADPSWIDTVDLEADITKAIGNNQTLISQRHSSGGKSTVDVNNRKRSIDEGEQKLTIEIKRLYQDMLVKRMEYNAAMTAYQKALLEKNAAEKSYQMGVVSQIQYLGAEVQYYQAEGTRKSKDTALFQSMLDYDWAVRGYAAIPD